MNQSTPTTRLGSHATVVSRSGPGATVSRIEEATPRNPAGGECYAAPTTRTLDSER